LSFGIVCCFNVGDYTNSNRFLHISDSKSSQLIERFESLDGDWFLRNENASCIVSIFDGRWIQNRFTFLFFLIDDFHQFASDMVGMTIDNGPL